MDYECPTGGNRCPARSAFLTIGSARVGGVPAGQLGPRRRRLSHGDVDTPLYHPRAPTTLRHRERISWAGDTGGTINEQGVRHEDVPRLSFADGSLGLIGTFDVLEHVPAYTEAMSEFFRCLRPGGMLVATVPFDLFRSEDSDPGDSRRRRERHSLSGTGDPRQSHRPRRVALLLQPSLGVRRPPPRGRLCGCGSNPVLESRPRLPGELPVAHHGPEARCRARWIRPCRWRTETFTEFSVGRNPRSTALLSSIVCPSRPLDKCPRRGTVSGVSPLLPGSAASGRI